MTNENQKAIEYFKNILDNMTIDKKAAAFIKLAIEALEKQEILNKKFSNAEPDFCLTEGFAEEEVKKICEDALYQANELREEKLMLLKQNVANQEHALRMASNTKSTNIAMQGFGQMANALWGTSFNVLEIVECKNCEAWNKTNITDLVGICQRFHKITTDIFFCKAGRRREEDILEDE